MTHYLKGLTLPLRYNCGVIEDGTGKTIIRACRDATDTPLMPAGRDAILKLACELLNEAFQSDKANQILKKSGY